MTELELKAKAEELEKLQKQYQEVIDKGNKEKQDALDAEKQAKLIDAIIEKLHGKSIGIPDGKMVFGKANAEQKGKVKEVSLASYLKMVKNSPEVIKTVMTGGVDADGGYAIPVEYMPDILGALYNPTTFPGMATKISQNRTMKAPKWLTGITVYWVDEDGTKTLGKATLSQVTMTLKKVCGIVPMTDELLDDNIVDLENKIEIVVGESINKEIERICLEGKTTSGDPFNGIVNTSGIKEVEQEGENLSYDDIVNIVFNPNVLRKYRATGQFWFNTDALRLIMKIKDDNKQPIWNLGNIVAGLPPTILGRPYNETDNLTTDTITKIIYGDPKYVILGDPKVNAGIQVSISNSAVAPASGSVTQNAFLQDETWYRFVKRQSITVAVAEAFSVGTKVK